MGDAYLIVKALYHFTEKEQGDHIENKMHVVGVNETGGKQAVIFIGFCDPLGPQDHSVINIGVAKSGNGDQYGEDDYDQGIAHEGQLL
jgi:hypothetical protein